ncbi:DNA-binding MurR/RpiR family transcriptional regulator [Clostridium tetanomorphum]|uniref:MurR/RpiR family transcriptional regulator n=1 Tax=Clostridium tetanomorphum TaxID=1553 RepID=A0A923E785_CLOTT|nr:MurR/RpiR family transcriptional regulator [Clostridium tetanomorphum]MBC2396349.1 MurR/RpiR family transcriptional regulator [Clostridium tetanomorphum]MBP1863422.1 DNA-binding MurR/RpiR family transcriptional regulator [Clostridium tetanomorphum]NRS83519.1 DNA-binding MurR/RpiR family transcriptional regulator [Clostridium tetanomorphum]NRZ96719.1 DNA-binding MurR/RpiR family transcriptional regulator [Clostridium tetanomorphum]SQC01893.1 RpiR family transcriptional regulator [Clostridium
MENNIFNIIEEKYSSFTKTFKLISDYIKKNYSNIVFLSIQELAESMGVSTSSITRYCKELGYEGYSEFQKAIQLLVQKDITPMREIKKSITDLRDEEDILKKTIELNIVGLQNMYSENLKIAFQKAVELVSQGKRIYIVGTRSTFTVAYYLDFMLSRFMDNIILLSPGQMDVYDRIYDIDEKDVLISISFSRYTKFTAEVTDFFKDKGCQIIAVTDSHSSPVAVKGNCVLILQNSSSTYSYAAAMTALNALVTAVGAKNKEKTLIKMNEKEKNCFENGIYV